MTMPILRIGERWIGDTNPTYFIADVAANHDGQLSRAIDLIHLAAEAGADAAKFQHFRAPKIVSKVGFESLGKQSSHQSKWKKSVFEVYQSASIPWEWTDELKSACDKANIEFLSSPYDFEAVDMLDRYIPAFKIGSGDITWPEELEYIAAKGKPVLLATGASDLRDIQRAMDIILPINSQVVLMQCNTNYTGSIDNFKYVQLNALRTFSLMFPDTVLGFSDHTPGHSAVLGAVALGARAVEKHFTDDCSREGPDHGFALNPRTWREMVDRTRELEMALGDANKSIQPNEMETVVLQRRCLRAVTDLPSGATLNEEHIEALRPAPLDAIFPYDQKLVVGRKLRSELKQGQYLKWTDLE